MGSAHPAQWRRALARAARDRRDAWADAYGSGHPEQAQCQHCGAPIAPYRPTQRWCAGHSAASMR
jgi:hypothetical protein